MVKYGCPGWCEGSTDRAKSFSHPRGAPRLETICSGLGWEEGDEVGRKDEEEKEERKGEIKKQDSSSSYVMINAKGEHDEIQDFLKDWLNMKS